MNHESTTEILRQGIAASSIAGAILTWWPLIFAIPGAIYYCVLLIEKFTGKAASSWFKHEED